ncbi:MAG: hypothetical protein RRY40_05715 [Oscillospiraceae bacterium]
MKNLSSAASIGIIGGADGPTAIFLAGNNWVGIALLFVLGIALGFAAAMLYRYFKNNK